MTERVIVFTMEKVGSSTVKWALEHAGYLVDRATPHNMNDFATKLRILKVITIIRDPIAQYISKMWEDRTAPAPGWHHMFMVDLLPGMTGIDPMRYYFNPGQGWQIYDERLLLIRTESLTSKLQDALTAFLGPANYLVDHRAKGVDRFGPGYVEFLEKTPSYGGPPERPYNTKYMRHFYTNEEIEGFKQRWLKK